MASKSHQPNRYIASFASKLVVSTVNRLQVEDSVPLLCDECGGLPRCFSKPPHSKYARIATLYSYFLFTCCYLVVMHLFPPYFPGNKLRHPSECTILTAVFKITLGYHIPDPINVYHVFNARSTHHHHRGHHFTQGKHCDGRCASPTHPTPPHPTPPHPTPVNMCADNIDHTP